MTDELLLLHKARRGDHDAFRGLYDLHVDALFRFLHQFSQNRHQVEDWVQRTFIKAYESMNRFAGRSRFSTWLFTIGLNEMRSDRRKPAGLLLENPEAHYDAVEDHADAFEWSDMMAGWLRELDEGRRSVFLLHEIEGFSHSEIAQILQIAESTSRSTLSRTRQWLQEQWNQERKAVP